MHAVLDKQIDGLESTGAFHDDTLSNLKKRRLQIRDEIERMRRRRDQEAEHSHNE
jgi:hypothetical protein